MNGKNFMKKLLLPLCALLLGGCISSSMPHNGAVCFTFDDFGGENWLKADAIFKKYDAHATFFIHGAIDEERLTVMKKLQSAGHSIGLHSVGHTAAYPLKNMTIEDYFNQQVKPQLDVCRVNGIEVRAFGYPNARRSVETDAYLLRHFDFLRANYGKKTVFYLPLTQIKSKTVLYGGSIGKYYKTKLENVTAIMDKAAAENMLVVFNSHNIMPGAESIHMPSEWLDKLLAHARRNNMKIIGINEIISLSEVK